jgi:hypothetical protein
MISIYILEFIGTALLAFLIASLRDSYAHIIIGTTLLLTGTLFTNNCFNPAIALCFLLTNRITFTSFFYYVLIEILAALTGFFLGKQIKTQQI